MAIRKPERPAVGGVAAMPPAAPPVAKSASGRPILAGQFSAPPPDALVEVASGVPDMSAAVALAASKRAQLAAEAGDPSLAFERSLQDLPAPAAVADVAVAAGAAGPSLSGLAASSPGELPPGDPAATDAPAVPSRAADELPAAGYVIVGGRRVAVATAAPQPADPPMEVIVQTGTVTDPALLAPIELVRPRPPLVMGGTGQRLMAALQERRSTAPQGDQQFAHAPAASLTDSPSRGQPRHIDDPGKRITGGFGNLESAQYFPLDGSEVLAVVWEVMDDLARKLPNDLRFSPALTYPRVAITIELKIEGYAVDPGQTLAIAVIGPPQDSTPIDLARAQADEIVFVLRSEKREVAADGTSDHPPNAMRLAAGLPIPHKQAVGDGDNVQMVDRLH